MGWTFNTANPNAETNAPTIVAVGIVFTSFALIAVCLRMYVRAFMIKAVGVDDWTICVTWFCSLGFMVATILQTKWGLGLQHLSDMPNANIYNFGLLQYIGAPFYITSILGFKLALLFSFLRIVVERTYRFVLIGIMTACCAFHFCFLVVQINLCHPVAKQWDPKITYGNCLVAVPFYTSMASITIVFDFIIMLSPFPLLIKSRIPTRKKGALVGLFSLGVFISIIQIIRIFTIKSLSNYIDSSKLIMWSMVENNLGIIVSCVPTLAPLFRYFRDGSKNYASNTGWSETKGTGGLSFNLRAMKSGTHGHVTLGSHNDMSDLVQQGENTTAISTWFYDGVLRLAPHEKKLVFKLMAKYAKKDAKKLKEPELPKPGTPQTIRQVQYQLDQLGPKVMELLSSPSQRKFDSFQRGVQRALDEGHLATVERDLAYQRIEQVIAKKPSNRKRVQKGELTAEYAQSIIREKECKTAKKAANKEARMLRQTANKEKKEQKAAWVAWRVSERLRKTAIKELPRGVVGEPALYKEQGSELIS
ncbi:hypothetical protein B7463_g6796, partial [Scytalidium lignicola]